MTAILVGLGTFTRVFARVLFLSLLLALPAMWLWNSLVPGVFGLPLVTFWQTFGMCVLLRLMLATRHGNAWQVSADLALSIIVLLVLWGAGK